MVVERIQTQAQSDVAKPITSIGFQDNEPTVMALPRLSCDPNKIMKNPLPYLAMLVLALGACDQIARKPKQDLSRIEAIDVRFNEGDFDYALAEMRKYTTDYPDCDQGWCLLGWVHAKLDDIESAKDCFDRAITLNPKLDNAFVGLGVVKRKDGDLQGARQAYTEATRILPENAEAFSSLLVLEILEQDYEAAAAYGEKAWVLRKDLASIPANLAVAYHYLGNEGKKRQYYQEAEKLGYHRLDAIDEIFADSVSSPNPE